MRLKTRYILGSASISIGCMIWYKWTTFHPIGTFFICAHVFFTQHTEWTKPIKIKSPKWNAKGFFSGLSIILIGVLFIILVTRIPEGQFKELLGTWYFTGVVWLLFMSGLTEKYIEAKKEVQ